jgi:hypothetical protein
LKARFVFGRRAISQGQNNLLEIKTPLSGFSQSTLLPGLQIIDFGIFAVPPGTVCIAQVLGFNSQARAVIVEIGTLAFREL